MSAPHILVIDDEDDIRAVVQVSLEDIAGWRVSVAASGGEGLALAARERPDAILLDVMMPEMDGPTTFAQLQADPATRTIPVVLLTAKVQPGDRRRFEDLGVAGTIPKPFDPLILARRVQEVLGWP